MTEHVKSQNWFAVALDFFIVVVGILIAFQITEWNERREQRLSERGYLEQLRSDVVELTDRRENYNRSRPINLMILEGITDFTNGYTEDPSDKVFYDVNWIQTNYAQRAQEFLAAGVDLEVVADSFTCNMVDWSSSLTVPPSQLPTASELIASGKLEKLNSEKVKGALLSYMQQASRAEEFILATQLKTVNLSDKFPELFEIRYLKGVNFALQEEESYPQYKCDFDAMRQNNAFLNALNLNRSLYAEYTNRGVIPASERLVELHGAIDEVLGVTHTNETKATK
ncbi:MAG: hypothetical protein AAFO63_11980 [Pseudomonadota bacterium]